MTNATKTRRTRKARKSSKPRRDVYQEITDRMVEALEAGTVPWRREWKQGAGGMPRNASTGKAYRGINVVALWMAAQAAAFSTCEWLTYKQAEALGGNVRKGEKGTRIVFWARKEIEEDGETREIWWMRTYTVFNLDQCDGIGETAEPVTPQAEAAAVADAWVSQEGIGMLAGAPSYSPSEDAIRMPAADRFTTAAAYHSTLFHEITHSTGHKSRLDRLAESFSFGDHAYSKEELVAEMGAAFLCAMTGIEDERTTENSAAYLAHWIAALKGDPKLVVSAAQAAQKAADRVLAASAAEVAEAA